jgi:YlmC/YmxH family sporulation protein
VRLSDLAGKELVDMQNGEKIGPLGHADLWIDSKTGKIGYLVLPAGSGFLRIGKKADEQTVPWAAVKKVGTDMILIDLKPEIRSGE